MSDLAAAPLTLQSLTEHEREQRFDALFVSHAVPDDVEVVA